MRPSLRRSCAACAKSKSSCDLGTPRCSRCTRRKIECAYANEPSTKSATPGPPESGSLEPPGKYDGLMTYRFGHFDPFDSYPPTRLPREHVQRLIHGFLNKIAFQYYPLDLSATSNPFLISWWPLALGDPALFHVSLQTACLDEELLAQKGFQSSELLMADSVALLRRKVEDVSLAMQDGTMNSVITLATIEFGKGNVKVGRMHVDGVKKLVDLRGGINSVRQTSPLTARMVSWVSMLIMGHPQFETQDDYGIGDGIPPIPEWRLESTVNSENTFDVNALEIDPAVQNVFVRLRNVMQRAQQVPFTTTQIHDLTCFVVHRLLLSSNAAACLVSPITECIRCAIILYMFIVQGPTYYPHAVISNEIVIRLFEHFRYLAPPTHMVDSLDVWLVAVGMVASTGTDHLQKFMERACEIATTLQLHSFEQVLVHLRSVLWLDKSNIEEMFRSHWDIIFNLADPTESSYLAAFSASPDMTGAMFI
ncbi:unnamed protein product [Penicillium salamii]|uniref:Zn(2)-C6 fungal-type domain-containing protein n=1 Tax=Penicillium salamii TaxID=1612424 RepID=A0A9W4I5C2_9EURO|nr:unnamed protein product [Penicillium salamii]CAG8271976.1 unnamed protein product [Penicillium salamii]CAG8379730.1 unnamed protein product [Penicillium salamii]CAG8380556.1 unnamed protein product [Penicillium salamii]